MFYTPSDKYYFNLFYFEGIVNNPLFEYGENPYFEKLNSLPPHILSASDATPIRLGMLIDILRQENTKKNIYNDYVDWDGYFFKYILLYYTAIIDISRAIEYLQTYLDRISTGDQWDFLFFAQNSIEYIYESFRYVIIDIGQKKHELMDFIQARLGELDGGADYDDIADIDKPQIKKQKKNIEHPDVFDFEQSFIDNIYELLIHKKLFLSVQSDSFNKLLNNKTIFNKIKMESTVIRTIDFFMRLSYSNNNKIKKGWGFKKRLMYYLQDKIECKKHDKFCCLTFNQLKRISDDTYKIPKDDERILLDILPDYRTTNQKLP